MTHAFDRDYWNQHWHGTEGDRPGSMAGAPPNPYLARETGDLTPGTALDAGCGAGAEAIWLAAHGWQVTAADIAADALAHAEARAAHALETRTELLAGELPQALTAYLATLELPLLGVPARLPDVGASGGFCL